MIRFFIPFVLVSLCMALSCEPSGAGNTSHTVRVHEKTGAIIDSGHILSTRFQPPAGYVREEVSTRSFAAYLRVLPLKPAGSQVHTYSGQVISGDERYCAVVDLPIGTKDLHQCADAVMRLRAEYLWGEKKYNAIGFHLTNGFYMGYTPWMEGMRLRVNGNTTQWVSKTTASNTHDDLWNWLQVIFTYAGTLSLSKELVPVSVSDMQIGDVFIRGGSPGHAVIVVDMATNTTTGEKVFMLAQSYMPAQDLQILINPAVSGGDPWYPLSFGDELITPSWQFTAQQIMRFP